MTAEPTARQRIANLWSRGFSVEPYLDAFEAEVTAAAYRAAADEIDQETRVAKADGVLEPDNFRPCRDASAQLRARADQMEQQ